MTENSNQNLGDGENRRPREEGGGLMVGTVPSKGICRVYILLLLFYRWMVLVESGSCENSGVRLVVTLAMAEDGLGDDSLLVDNRLDHLGDVWGWVWLVGWK